MKSIESGKDEAPREVVQLAMKDQKFRLTRGKDGQKTNYQVRKIIINGPTLIIFVIRIRIVVDLVANQMTSNQSL